MTQEVPIPIPAWTFPAIALSVRQPWAWAIIHGGKDVENRSRLAITKGAMRPGRIAIHASKGMGRDEYLGAARFMDSLSVRCPEAADLPRGGIIGSVQVVEIVRACASPWFFGPCGLVLRDPRPCAFIPAAGQLGYFTWSRAAVDTIPPPSPWMLKRVRPAPLLEPSKPAEVEAPLPDLFRDATAGD